MKNLRPALLVAGLGLTAALATPVSATVEAFLEYNVPYAQPQTGDICLRRLPVLASLGVPGAAVAQASLKPTRVYKDFPAPSYVNINLAATTPPMVHTYVSDSINEAGEWRYSMKLDVSALAAANGGTLDGRARTIRAAKLALLAIAKDLEDLSAGNYYLRATFVGLPSQSGLAGTPLHATTVYAYSVASPLLGQYEAELLDQHGSCP
jgi:hypothetical protein